MKIVIKGNPIPLKRHRTTKAGIAYDPQTHEKEDTRWLIHTETRKQNILMPPVLRPHPFKVDFLFLMPIPSSFSEKKKTQLLATPHFKKPDLDNLIKFYLDAGTEILWHDDSNISIITARKLYDIDPRVEITIETL